MSQTRARQIYEANVHMFFFDRGLEEGGKLKGLSTLRREYPGHCQY
ncbi:hypothetical protein [Desulfoluna butyratoxydans]|nr:hypothetical protein [Desulfoluna butyratoxydans]